MRYSKAFRSHDHFYKFQKYFQCEKLNGVESMWETRGTKLKGDHSLLTQSDEHIDISKLEPINMIDERTKAVMEYLQIPYQWSSGL